MSAQISEALLSWAGLLGVVLYLGSYGALQAGFIRGVGYTYATLNLLAAGLVLVSLSQAFNLHSAVIQVFWMAFSLFGIARLFLLNRRLRFSQEEQILLDTAFEGMEKSTARRLLNTGVWSDAAPGTRLTQEGACVTHLHFLAQGSAEVVSGGIAVAEIGQGLIGEMNVMEGGAASASVTTTAPSRVFTVSGDTLRRLTRNDRDIRMALERCLSLSTKSKLVAANTRLATAARR